MKSLLFALGLALCCFVQADEDQRLENIDLNLLLPKGFVVAMITNCTCLHNKTKMKKEEYKAALMKAIPVSLEKLSENKLQITMEMPKKEGCKTIKMMLEREDGVFIIKCGKGGKKIVEDIRINGKESMFISIKVYRKHGPCKKAYLVVTDLANTQAAKDDFTAFGGRQGLEGKETKLLPTEGMCPYSS